MITAGQIRRGLTTISSVFTSIYNFIFVILIVNQLDINNRNREDNDEIVYDDDTRRISSHAHYYANVWLIGELIGLISTLFLKYTTTFGYVTKDGKKFNQLFIFKFLSLFHFIVIYTNSIGFAAEVYRNHYNDGLPGNLYYLREMLYVFSAFTWVSACIMVFGFLLLTRRWVKIYCACFLIPFNLIIWLSQIFLMVGYCLFHCILIFVLPKEVFDSICKIGEEYNKQLKYELSFASKDDECTVKLNSEYSRYRATMACLFITPLLILASFITCSIILEVLSPNSVATASHIILEDNEFYSNMWIAMKCFQFFVDFLQQILRLIVAKKYYDFKCYVRDQIFLEIRQFNSIRILVFLNYLEYLFGYFKGKVNELANGTEKDELLSKINQIEERIEEYKGEQLAELELIKTIQKKIHDKMVEIIEFVYDYELPDDEEKTKITEGSEDASPTDVVKNVAKNAAKSAGLPV